MIRIEEENLVVGSRLQSFPTARLGCLTSQNIPQVGQGVVLGRVVLRNTLVDVRTLWTVVQLAFLGILTVIGDVILPTDGVRKFINPSSHFNGKFSS